LTRRDASFNLVAMKPDTYTKIVLTVIALFVICTWLQRRKPMQVVAHVKAEVLLGGKPAPLPPMGFTAGKFATL
jgi:hypothetical protein